MTVYRADFFLFKTSFIGIYKCWKLRSKRSNMRKEAKKVERKQSSVKCTAQRKNDQKWKRAEKEETKEEEEKEREE